MDFRKFAQDVFSDQFGKAESCYLCGCAPIDFTSACGVKDCPLHVIPRDELPGADETFEPRRGISNHEMTEDERLDDPRHVPYSNLGRR